MSQETGDPASQFLTNMSQETGVIFASRLRRGRTGSSIFLLHRSRDRDENRTRLGAQMEEIIDWLRSS